MKQLLSTIKELKNQARINHETLTEMGFKISYMQCMQLVAKSHGYKSWEVIQTKALKEDLAINVESSNEIELNTQLSDNLWIKIGNTSICIRDNEDHFKISFNKFGEEDTDGIDYVLSKEAIEEISEVDDYYIEKEKQAIEIKIEYLESNKKNKDLKNAVERLLTECNIIYSSEESASEYLKEPLVVYEIKLYQTENNYNSRTPEYINEYYDADIAVKEAIKLEKSATKPFKVVVVERCDVDGGNYIYETQKSAKNKIR